MSITAVLFVILYFTLTIKALSGRPLFGLFAYILPIYMYPPGSWWGGSLPDLRWSLLASLVTLISIWLYTKKIRQEANENRSALVQGAWYQSPVTKLFLLFIIWVSVQNIWALSGVLNAKHTILVVKLFLLMFLINKCIVTRKDLEYVILAHIIGCSFFGYLGLSHGGGRFESVPTPGMNDGNLLSIHMEPFLIAAAYLILSQKGKLQFLPIPFILLTLNAIFLTQSRGAIVGLAGVGVLSLLLVPKVKAKLFMFYAALALVGGISIMGSAFIDRLKATRDTQAQSGHMDKSAESRFVIIQAQLEMFKSRPILGYGHRGTLILSPTYLSAEWLTSSDGREARRASHNLTMTTLVDHGIIGCFLYLGMFFVLAWKAWRYRKVIISSKDPLIYSYIGCLLGTASVLITSQFANTMKLEVGIWMVTLAGIATLAFEQKYVKRGKSKTGKISES